MLGACCCVANPTGSEKAVEVDTPESAFQGEVALPVLPPAPEKEEKPAPAPATQKEDKDVEKPAENPDEAISMTPEEMEQEKVRLQNLVKDFAKDAVGGISVDRVDIATGKKEPYIFQMDRYLTVFTVKPKGGSGTNEESAVKDLSVIYKGAEVETKAPSLGSIASSCVGLDSRGDKKLIFYFEDSYEREKFYTCLKILRMSVDIKRPDS